jgi:pyridoxal phosphate enzyme (YggS family)
LETSLTINAFMTTIAQHIKDINQLIFKEEIACHRPPGAVTLLAVSKGHSADEIKLAYLEGLVEFGESYVQEALLKINALSHLPLSWHFIGPIQGNKAKYIARHFSWAHSISQEKTARQLNEARPATSPPLQITIQVNFDDEINKNGTNPKDVLALASIILKLPRLKLRGLMLIPKPERDETQQYLSFIRLTNLMQSVNSQLNITMDTLSMGMSHDFKAAIRAGSTLIRLGTALFGARK